MWFLPVVTTGWLVLIAWATMTGQIPGIQVGIPLAVTGAGLLTLLGFQIAWANSQEKKTTSHPAAVVLKSGAKLLVE